MHCIDVNVLVYARRAEMAQHAACREWIEAQVNGDEPFCLPDSTQLGFVRIVTNARIFRPPTSARDAFEFLNLLRSAPTYRHIGSSERRWEVFQQLCVDNAATGDAVPDAYLAALALEANAVLATCDRGFARFAGLRLVDPSR